MRKSFFILLSGCLFLAIGSLQAQTGKVGVNTENPKKDLDVNGDLQLRGKIYLGGTDTTDGDPGQGAQVLTSGGTGGSPSWVTLAIPQVEAGGFYLQASQVVRDDVGNTFGTNDGGATMYADGDLLSGMVGFKVFPGLDARITIPEYTVQPTDPAGTVYNRTNFHLETTVMQPQASSENGWTTFAIGIFIQEEGSPDYVLKGVRVGRMEGWYGSFMTFDMVCLVDNLPAGSHNVRVAAVRRSNQNYNQGGNTEFAIGCPAPTFTTVNRFMCQTNMKIEIFKRDMTNPGTP